MLSNAHTPMRKIILLAIISCTAVTVFAQDFTLKDSISLDFEPQQIQAHNQGFLLSDQHGNLFLVDFTGKIRQTFSPTQMPSISDFRHQNNFNTLVFYKDLQKIITLNQFLVPVQTLDLHDLSTDYISCIAPSADRQIWIANNAHFSVQKFNPFTSEIWEVFTFDFITEYADIEILRLEEYQNLLFLETNHQEVMIFDNLGNAQQKPLQKMENGRFHFHEKEIYFLEKDQIVFYNFYGNQKRSFNIKHRHQIIDCLFLNEKIYLIQKNQILIFSK